MKITVLIISYKSLEKLQKCIEKIGNNREILVVENSSQKKIKEVIESEYDNCKVILNNSNLGYAKASNIGFNNIKTDYALLLNTDIVITDKQINEIEDKIKSLDNDFSLASPISDDLIDFNQNNKIDKFFVSNNEGFNYQQEISQIALVKGCSLVVNLKKFNNEDVFDDNYFFFFEEMDLCRKIKKRDEKIFVFNKIRVEHKSAQSLDENLNVKYHNFRHWNYFWGRFYYFKKNYGYLYALITHISKLLRFGFNILKYFFISKSHFNKNKYRFLGLLYSIIGKSSKLSVKILEE